MLHPGGQRLAARVHGQDGLATLPVRTVDDDLPVETPRAQQRRVEDVGPVGRGHDDDALVGLEAVHLHQQLVEGLLALVVTAAQAGAAMAADGVDLVDEDDAGLVLLGLVEEVTDAAGADPHEHLHEVGSGDAEEGDPGLAGHGPRQQRLAGARRSEQQHALGDAGAEALEAFGVLEELLDLVEFLDRFVHSGHVLERDLGLVDGHALGSRLAEAHHLAAASLHLVHQEDEEDDHEKDGRKGAQQRDPHRALLDIGAEFHLVRQKVLFHVPGSREPDLEGLAILEFPFDHQVFRLESDRLLDVPLFDRRLELVEGQLLRRPGTVEEVLDEESQQYDEENREGGALEEPAHLYSTIRSIMGRDTTICPLCHPGNLAPAAAVSRPGRRVRQPRSSMTPMKGRFLCCLGVVEPVADHELVRYLEAGVATLQLRPAPAGLAEQGDHLQTGRVPGAQVVGEVLQGEAGIDDVLHDKDVAALDVDVEVLEDPHHARAVRGATVAGDGHELHLQVEGQPRGRDRP